MMSSGARTGGTRTGTLRTSGTQKRSVLALVGALAAASCVHQVQVASPGGSRKATPVRSAQTTRTAVSTVMARQVQNAVDAGDGDLEAKTLRQRLAANSNDLDARILLARLYARRGLPDLALEHYRLAAIRFPDSIVATLSLAKALHEEGESGEALKALDQGIARRPEGSWELLSLKGIFEEEQGQLESAEAAHRSALALEPERSALHNNLGYDLLLQGRAEAAAAEFRRAIELDPRSEIAHNNLGAALASLPKPDASEALSELQRSASPAVAHNNLAAVLIQQGRYAEARTELDKALESRRDFPEALANLKLLAERDGQPIRIPDASPPVNFWRRVASTWARVVPGRSAPKAAQSGNGQSVNAQPGNEGSEGVSAGAPSPVDETRTSPAPATERK